MKLKYKIIGTAVIGILFTVFVPMILKLILGIALVAIGYYAYHKFFKQKKMIPRN